MLIILVCIIVPCTNVGLHQISKRQSSIKLEEPHFELI